MKILNHRLHTDDGEQLPFVETRNKGGEVEHQLLVMHFTAGGSADGSISWLSNPHSRASAHVVIGQDGSVTQLVPFNRVAWHAGKSEWLGRSRVNEFSIGIELDNAGRLVRNGDRWRAWFGREYPPEQCLEATHRFESESCGWHLYPEAQIAAAVEVGVALMEKYPLWDVVGHDDISPFRKVDPGPAFPMESYRSRVLGRQDDAPDLYETTVALNIRHGPGTDFERFEASPLAPGTEVQLLSSSGNWRFVSVLDDDDETRDLEGWVHGRFLKRAGG